MNSSKGIIGLTTDIIDNLAANFVVTPKKVITNGVSEKSYAFTKFKPFDGNNLELIFSGSSYLEWHGLERLTDSLNKLRTHIKINLNIVGTFPTNKLRSTNANFNIIYHGLLDCKKSEKIFRNCNLAIGTLALYTKGMQEASPLKSREYFCRGIPFIKAYYDTDIDKYAEMKQFCLDFPDNNSEIDFNQVIEFIKDMSSQTYDVALRMRELAIEKLNWTIKVKEYFDFLEI